MSSKNNQAIRDRNMPEIVQFLEDAGLSYDYVHGFEWHIRVENAIDIYPTRRKYHILKTGVRGQFYDYESLGQVFLENIEKE